MEQRLRLHVFPVLGRSQLRNVRPSTVQSWLRSIDHLAPRTRKLIENLSPALWGRPLGWTTVVLVIPVLALATIVGVVGLVISGAADVVVGVHRRVRKRGWSPLLAQGGIELVLAVLLAGAPFVAADHAERSNDWVDVDGDGMADPMVNGSYDWVDVNGGDFARAWGALGGVMVAPAAVALYALSKRPDPSDVRRDVRPVSSPETR